MAGSSRTNMEATYGVGLSGVITSQWGEDMNVTVDDKLHKSQTSVQTAAGPVNWTTSATHTFAGALNANGGAVCVWDVDNSAVTRYASLSHRDLLLLVTDSGAFNWIYDAGNSWVDYALQVVSSTPFRLPHGATVTALRVISQVTGGAGLTIYLRRIAFTTGTLETLGSVVAPGSMAEVADTSIGNAVVDNDTYSYHINMVHSGTAAEVRVRSVQVDYTVARPQP